MRLFGMITKPRARSKVHYIVVIGSASIILFLYYAYRYSMPTYPGHWLDWFWDTFLFELHIYCLGLLLLIPILYSTLTLSWRRSSIIVLALIICIAPYVINFYFLGAVPFTSFAALITPAAIVICIDLEKESRVKEKKIEAEKEKERTIFLRQRYKTQENERKRIAQELHDGVIQTLMVNSSLIHDVLSNNSIKPPSAIENVLKTIENNSLNIADDIRRICQDLRPSVLDHLGLVPAMRWLADRFSEETRIKVNFVIKGSIYEMAYEENTNLFRLIQETLNNVRRHSEATSVDISLMVLDSKLSIVIMDNGKGFHLPENIQSLASAGKLGILGMYERARSIGASLQVDSEVDLGTVVKILLHRNNGLPS